jgi:hypothetical protein
MLTDETATRAEMLSEVRPFRELAETSGDVATIVRPTAGQRIVGGAPTAGAVRYSPADERSLDPRTAGRRIAAMTPAAEREALYAEQQRLAIKKVTEALTPAEERRLKLVRWNIDRIEDADFGPEIDSLELRANMLEKLATNVQHFLGEARTRQRR